jgi:hypothetical protein
MVQSWDSSFQSLLRNIHEERGIKVLNLRTIDRRFGRVEFWFSALLPNNVERRT